MNATDGSATDGRADNVSATGETVRVATAPIVSPLS